MRHMGYHVAAHIHSYRLWMGMARGPVESGSNVDDDTHTETIMMEIFGYEDPQDSAAAALSYCHLPPFVICHKVK
jgi:hypothetical protein